MEELTEAQKRDLEEHKAALKRLIEQPGEMPETKEQAQWDMCLSEKIKQRIKEARLKEFASLLAKDKGTTTKKRTKTCRGEKDNDNR